MSLQAPPMPPACSAFIADAPSFYGYRPSLAAGIIFSILFGLVAATHVWHTIQHKTWWMLLFVVGAGLECLGWIGRTIGYSCPYSRDLYIMQIATLIMGPGYAQAGVYMVVWVLIKRLGQRTFPLPPKTYLWICFWMDFVCLSLQAVGGGIASAAFNDGSNTGPGTKTLVAGIVSQLAAACLFATMLFIMYYRAHGELREKRNQEEMVVFLSAVLATGMMICRNVYRSVELLEGWRGRLMLNQSYVIALDGVPMLLTMGAFAIVNGRKALMHVRRSTEGTGRSYGEAEADKETETHAQVVR